jgi:hypothetical protein
MKEKTGSTHHPSTINVTSMMLAAHGVPHSTPSHVQGTLTAHEVPAAVYESAHGCVQQI